MSFGGFGSGGFGQNQNNQTSSAFGGFGQTSTSGGFGSTSTAFGSQPNNPGGLFGSNNSNNNTGSTFGGFGSTTNNSSPFGQNKPAFGATSAGASLFGSGSTTTAGSTGFGGFGNTASGGFGSASNTGGFGSASKPAFGASSGGGLFGSGTTATGSTGFGSSTTATSAFGSGSPFASNQQNNGTQNPQFSPFTEKEANATNQYQTITAMPAYQKFQVEELRLVDYAQGRKYGNGTAQAGAFGTSTGFGGFGSNQSAPSTGFGASAGNSSGGLFGNNSTSTPFGAASSASNAFGSNNAGAGLFGAKPAGTGLFGNTTASSAPASGGLFGTSGGFGSNTTGGFGAATSTPAFGQSQNKPLFGGGATTGFGANNSTGTSLFGNNANAGSAFGQTQQSTPAGGFSFGQQNQQQQQQPQPNQTTGGLFGGFANANNQAKPGGLFGTNTNTNTTGGLFGQQQQQQPTTQQAGGLFGNSTNQQTGGLFGNKPAGSGLFGASNTTPSGGLFGSANATQQQPQQASTGGLFGSTNAQSGTGLFGAKSAGTGIGGGLFGQNTTQQQPATSLFGNSQQPQPGTQLGSSLFGSTNQQQPLQQSQGNHLVASLNDNPYGNYQLFASLNTPTQSPGPLATPVGLASTARKQAIIPHYRVVPHASSRLLTPQKRPQGYGFTYSNYNSPMSPAANMSPGSSLLGGPTLLGRSVSKSLSASNLRNSYSAQESILSPGAFSSNRVGQSNMKKLNINRTLSQRRSLFANDAPAAGLSKRVSFDKDVSDDSAAQQMSGALVRTESNEENATTPENHSTVSQNGESTGKELAIVLEDSSASTAGASALQSENRKARLLREDQTPGEYTMDPPLEKLRAMTRQQRAAVRNFTVRREGVGQIVFSQADVNGVPLEQICGEVVELNTRQATVYGDKSPVRTPPQGQGLNVPSTITLENSWPRQKGGRLKIPDRKSLQFDKHVRILKSAKDTHFVSYDEVTGRWTFRVDHYTTYGLNYDDEDYSAITTTISHDDHLNHQELAQADRPKANETPELQPDESLSDSQGSGVDDTFDFKKSKTKHVPGDFDNETMEEIESAFGSRPRAQAHDFANVDDINVEDPFLQIADLDTYQILGDPAMLMEDDLAVKPITAEVEGMDLAKAASPARAEQLWLGGDWTEHLQHTLSPVKRFRPAMAPANEYFDDSLQPNLQEQRVSDHRDTAFESTLDIMKSLFGQSVNGSSRDSENNRSFKRRDKVQRLPSSARPGSEKRIASIGKSGPFADSASLNARVVDYQREHTQIVPSKGKIPAAPHASPRLDIDPSKIAKLVDTSSPAGQHEQSMWELTSILFREDSAAEIPAGMDDQSRATLMNAVCKDSVGTFWRRLVQHESQTAAQFGKTQEEKALLQLIGGDTVEACTTLLTSNDFHLAQLIAQLPGDRTLRNTIDQQIEVWRKRTDWSEMDDSVRAMYEISSGNVCECRGLSITGQENKATAFKLSTRYRFDWRRAFGLRLWYGILKTDGIDEAVNLYSRELAEYKESAIPSPWFQLRLEDQGWTDPEPSSRQDILWSLLKIHAAVHDEEQSSYQIQDVFAPESVAGHPSDARLSFQLLSTLMVMPNANLDHAKASKVLNDLALKYAEMLDSQIHLHPECLITAIWVLLHISDQKSRSEQIRLLLNKHADILEPSHDISKTLTANDGLQIPYVWICSALAKHAETTSNDAVAQARWLIEGGELIEAHEVICRKIGPEAVISLHYDSLRDILVAAQATDMQRKVEWDTGAGLYLDFLELSGLQNATKNNENRARTKQLVKKMTSSLEASSAKVQDDDITKAEKIAVRLMAEEVLAVAQKEKITAVESLLTLPLTESGYLQQSMAASVSFYQALTLKA